VLVQEKFLRKKFKDPITNGDFVPLPAAGGGVLPGPAPAQGRGGVAQPGPAPTRQGQRLAVRQALWAAVAPPVLQQGLASRRRRFPVSAEAAEASSVSPVRAPPSQSAPTKGRRTTTNGASFTLRQPRHPAASRARSRPVRVCPEQPSRVSVVNHRLAGDSPVRSAHQVNRACPARRSNPQRQVLRFHRLAAGRFNPVRPTLPVALVSVPFIKTFDFFIWSASHDHH
jgi:hypothetical protein